MNSWINGRKRTRMDCRDRGLQYGDGVFETMRIRQGGVRFLEYHLERLELGCRQLQIADVRVGVLRRELESVALRRGNGILKLIVTRGLGPRGYRPTGRERCTRIMTLHALPRSVLADESTPARIRQCATPLGLNPRLAGLKTLNRLESVMARAEWRDAGIWEGLMQDVDENIVCGTMSNLFLRRGAILMTPVIDRCGVAGVMRRWILETAGDLRLRATERRLRWQDLCEADEVFMSNAVIGIRSVGMIERGRERLRPSSFESANRLRERLDSL
ncbi:MAG TPA: aminodeoxychorismate lyase [Steroidobacteraceae bacterium]|nr:aminodeoxychorismate lyase [Steroidobacteraceae bacterium]